MSDTKDKVVDALFDLLGNHDNLQLPRLREKVEKLVEQIGDYVIARLEAAEEIKAQELDQIEKEFFEGESL